MSSLSRNQVQQLHAYSVYVDEQATVLFQLKNLKDDAFLPDFMNLLFAVSGVNSETIALSYFTKRYGMFISMQFYMLCTYDEVWDGDLSQLQFAVREEFGRPALCTFVHSDDWRPIETDERKDVISRILKEQCYEVFLQLRKITSVSPLMLWENIFGYMLWHYHTLLSNPGTEDQAMIDLAMLEDSEVWSSFVPQSYFANYTGGMHPSTLVQIPVRKTCCFSKDIPGWMQCGFCPLKK